MTFWNRLGLALMLAVVLMVIDSENANRTILVIVWMIAGGLLVLPLKRKG